MQRATDPGDSAHPESAKATFMQLSDPTLLKTHCLIDGQWIGAASGSTLDVRNPATGQLLGQVPSLGANETEHAIAAAERAWPAWRARTAEDRASRYTASTSATWAC